MVQFRVRILLACLAITAGGVTAVAAQTQEHAPEPSGPAPVLMTVREMLQPGAEATHAKLEAEYAATLDAGKGKQYYLGMGSITGKQQTVFISGYSSLEEMSEVHDQDDTALGEKLASLDEAHSGTLAGVDTAIWRLRPELSNPGVENLAKMRFIELIQIHVKLGHSAGFADVIKNIKEAWMKTDPNFHYSLYQQTFGSSTDDSYMLIIAMKSLADLDKHHSMAAEYKKALGEEVQKHMLEFVSANYNSTESNLYVFTPSMSRLPENWTKDDQDFWKSKPVTAVPAKKAAPAK